MGATLDKTIQPTGEIWLTQNGNNLNPTDATSYGTIDLGQVMSIEFDFDFHGRSNDPPDRAGYQENFFRIGYDTCCTAGCDGEGSSYPAMFLARSSIGDILDIKVSDGTTCGATNYLSHYTLSTNHTHHIKISFNNTQVVVDITGGGQLPYTKQWSRHQTLKDYLGDTVNVYFLSPTFYSTPFNRGWATFNNIIIKSNIFTFAPTAVPTTPSIYPSIVPSIAPTNPTNVPSIAPSIYPSIVPSVAPSIYPSIAPTQLPSITPTQLPLIAPTKNPISAPTNNPLPEPTSKPTPLPTNQPTPATTENPTIALSISPTPAPTNEPTLAPTNVPTHAPSVWASMQPSKNPSRLPTNNPSTSPSIDSILTTQVPTVTPSRLPSISSLYNLIISSTKNPTISPIHNPLIMHTDWVAKVSTNCPNGFEDLEHDNSYRNKYCKPCHGNTAGTNGVCRTCSSLKEPNHTKTDCQWTSILYILTVFSFLFVGVCTCTLKKIGTEIKTFITAKCCIQHAKKDVKQQLSNICMDEVRDGSVLDGGGQRTISSDTASMAILQIPNDDNDNENNTDDNDDVGGGTNDELVVRANHNIGFHIDVYDDII